MHAFYCKHCRYTVAETPFYAHSHTGKKKKIYSCKCIACTKERSISMIITEERRALIVGYGRRYARCYSMKLYKWLWGPQSFTETINLHSVCADGGFYPWIVIYKTFIHAFHVCVCLRDFSRHLANHRAAVVDELCQHHGHVVVDSGGVVRPLGRVSNKCPQSEYSCTPHLQRRKTRHPQHFFGFFLSCEKQLKWDSSSVAGAPLSAFRSETQTFALRIHANIIQCLVRQVDEGFRGNYRSIFS